MEDHKKNRDPARAQARAMTDARCAWRKMSDVQRVEFMTWIQVEMAAAVKKLRKGNRS